MALRASWFLLSNLITTVLCQPSYINAVVDDASAQVVFTPPVCNAGQMVRSDQHPDECDATWFLVSDPSSTPDATWHATHSPSSRAFLQFQGSGVSWFSAPDSQGRGTADVFLDNTLLVRVTLSPNNTGSNNSVWSSTDLDPSSTHNLTIVPLGDDIVTVDFFTVLTPQNTSAPDASTSSTPPPADAPDPGGASQKDGSSGAVISAASIGSVALVVIACGGCFFLGKRRKRPGFHMPTVLVDIESALEHPDSPAPTHIRAWRESAHKAAPAEGGSSERHHPDGAANSRPPSYRSAKDTLSLSEESDQSHEGHWQ